MIKHNTVVILGVTYRLYKTRPHDPKGPKAERSKKLLNAVRLTEIPSLLSKLTVGIRSHSLESDELANAEIRTLVTAHKLAAIVCKLDTSWSIKGFLEFFRLHVPR